MKQDGKTYLVARVSSATIDALAAFEAEGEDRENDLCDEPSLGCAAGPACETDLEHDTSDDEPDHDTEPDSDDDIGMGGS